MPGACSWNCSPAGWKAGVSIWQELCDATDLKPNIALHWARLARWARPGLIESVPRTRLPRSDLTDAGADSMRAYLLASLSLSPWVQ